MARAPPEFACGDSAAPGWAALQSRVHACAALRPCIAGAGKLPGMLVSSVAGACSFGSQVAKAQAALQPWRHSRILCARARVCRKGMPGCSGCVFRQDAPSFALASWDGVLPWMEFCTGDCQSLAGLCRSHCYAHCTMCEQGILHWVFDAVSSLNKRCQPLNNGIACTKSSSDRFVLPVLCIVAT